MTLRQPSDQLLLGISITVLCALLGAVAGMAPALAIIASLAVIFVFVSIWNLTAGVSFFAIIIFLESLVRGSVDSGIKLAGLLLAFSWLAKIAIENHSRLNLLWRSHPHVTYLMLAFVAWVAIGAVWAENPADALTDASRFLLNFTLFAIIFTAARQRVEVGWLLAMFLVGVAVTAIYGLVVHPVEDPRKADRVMSAVGNPNELAAVLVAGLAMAAGAALAMKGSFLRVLAAMSVVLTLSTLILTGSRGGTIAMIVALVAAIVFAGRWRPQVFAIAALVLVSGVGFFFTLTPQVIQDRLLTATPGELDASSEARGTIWAVGWEMAKDNLAKGVGSDNYNEVSPDYLFLTGDLQRSDQIIDDSKTIHNMYLQGLAELGVFGLAMFLAILGFGLSCTWQAIQTFMRNGDVRMEIISRSLLVAMVGVMVAGFFSSHQFGKWFWFLFALGPVLLALARRESGEGNPPALEPEARPLRAALPARSAPRPF